MKTLLLMRHAKSDWDADFETDHDRPINERGRRAAALMGEWLARTDQEPALVVSSTAVRAATTVDLAASSGDWSCPIRRDERIYEATARKLLEVAGDTEEDFDSLMLVGHQPGMGALVATLVGGAEVRFPTAAVARIEVDVYAWNEIEPGTGTLSWLLPPRVLEAYTGRSKSEPPRI